jgi:hypothetical protein
LESCPVGELSCPDYEAFLIGDPFLFIPLPPSLPPSPLPEVLARWYLSCFRTLNIIATPVTIIMPNQNTFDTLLWSGQLSNQESSCNADTKEVE